MMNSGSDSFPLGEFALIAELFAPLATAAGAFGLTDDVAVYRPAAGRELVITTDAVLEGVHFFRSDPADLVARKALRVNLSDLASKGAVPSGYLLSLSLPEWVNMAWLKQFASGLALDQREYDVSLLGGDTTAAPDLLTIAVTALGEVPQGEIIRRKGATPGQIVFVTGAVGDAGGGLRCLKGDGAKLPIRDREYLIGRFHLPEPRIRIGLKLRNLASASIDVSDGLVADLSHLARASGVTIEIQESRIPVSESLARMIADPRERTVFAATAGDDYEIAFSAAPEMREDILRLASVSGAAIAEIGRAVDGESSVRLLDRGGVEIPVGKAGYIHF